MWCNRSVPRPKRNSKIAKLFNIEQCHLAIWQERARTILGNATISGFIETPLLLKKLKMKVKCWAAATYCLALLM